MSAYIEWGALGQVVLIGLVVGAGLPALFAVGVRALAGKGARDEQGRVPGARRALAYGAFGVVVVAVAVAVIAIAGGGH